jgi:hypothetical protein
MERTKPIVALVAMLAIAGCAGTDAMQVESLDADNRATGIRYYETAPYLLVHTDGKGGLKSQLLFLADLTQKRSIDPFAVLASNESTLTFKNGTLSQSKTVVDETVVPKAVITAVERAAAAAISASLNDPDASATAQVPPPRLYKIVIDSEKVRLVGGTTVDASGNPDTITVTISQPAKPEKPSEGGDQ